MKKSQGAGGAGAGAQNQREIGEKTPREIGEKTPRAQGRGAKSQSQAANGADSADITPLAGGINGEKTPLADIAQMLGVAVTKKRVKCFNIRVKPDGSVYMSAPLCATSAQIAEILQRRAGWIAAKREFFAKFRLQNAPKRLVSGEDFFYLGVRYRLKIVQQSSEGAVLEGEFFTLFVRDSGDFARKKRLIDEWYRARAGELFAALVGEFGARLGELPSGVKIRAMRSKWGTCNPRSRIITLNLALMQRPRRCLEYVVLHELAHLICPNHSREFYAIIAAHMCDWRERRAQLNEPLG